MAGNLLPGFSGAMPFSINQPKGTVAACGCTRAKIAQVSPWVTPNKVTLHRANTMTRGRTAATAPAPPMIPSLMTGITKIVAIGKAPQGPYWYGTRVHPAPGTVAASTPQPRRALVLPVANLVPLLSGRLASVAQ